MRNKSKTKQIRFEKIANQNNGSCINILYIYIESKIVQFLQYDPTKQTFEYERKLRNENGTHTHAQHVPKGKKIHSRNKVTVRNFCVDC